MSRPAGDCLLATHRTIPTLSLRMDLPLPASSAGSRGANIEPHIFFFEEGRNLILGRKMRQLLFYFCTKFPENPFFP